MKDAEWQALCALIPLPPDARPKIENLIHIYERHAVPQLPPHETKRELARIETWAGKMLAALDVDEVANAMLVSWERDGPPPPGLTRLDEAAVRIEEIHGSLARLQAWGRTMRTSCVRRFPVGASPTRRPLASEATGAAMEVTK